MNKDCLRLKNYENIFEQEHKWLQLIPDDQLGKKYYNLRKHKWGHWSTDINSSLTIKQKLSEASKKLHQDPIYREKFLEGRKKLPPQTKEQIEKRAKTTSAIRCGCLVPPFFILLPKISDE